MGRMSIPCGDAAMLWTYRTASSCRLRNWANAWNCSPHALRGGLVPLFAPTMAMTNASSGTPITRRASTRSPDVRGRNVWQSIPCGT